MPSKNANKVAAKVAADMRSADCPFSFQKASDGRVFISWYGRTVMIVRGFEAAKLLEKLNRSSSVGQQLLLAKKTGNFKRGNEYPDNSKSGCRVRF